MNVSANNLLVPASHTPVCWGRTFSQQIFLLAFCFAKVFGLWLILLIASLVGVIVSLQRRV